MRVLVTGGAGYVGSHTVKALCKFGHEPIIVDNLSCSKEPTFHKDLEVPFIKSCISNSNEILQIIKGKHYKLKGTKHENKNVQAIIHFAAFSIVGESIANPLMYYKNNVANSILFLEAVYKTNNSFKNNENNLPFIFSSSCSTYGVQNNFPITENYPKRPINPYAKSKYFIEEVIKDLSFAYKFKSIFLRYFNVAGASKDLLIGENRDHETHLIPLAIKTALGLNDHICVFGDDYDTSDGTCIRDYIHVCDVADAHVKVLEIMCRKFGLKGKNSEAFNIGIGNGYSVKEVIEIIEKISNKKIKTKIAGRRLGDPPILVASSEKFKKEFDWEPKNKTLESIIEDSFNWQKSLYKNSGLI